MDHSLSPAQNLSAGKSRWSVYLIHFSSKLLPRSLPDFLHTTYVSCGRSKGISSFNVAVSGSWIIHLTQPLASLERLYIIVWPRQPSAPSNYQRQVMDDLGPQLHKPHTRSNGDRNRDDNTKQTRSFPLVSGDHSPFPLVSLGCPQAKMTDDNADLYSSVGTVGMELRSPRLSQRLEVCTPL